MSRGRRKRREPNNHRSSRKIVLVVVACIAMAVALMLFSKDKIAIAFTKQQTPTATVFSAPMLEKVIKESRISTFTAVYNGIAEVPDPENPDVISYYVRYEARVRAGFDLNDLKLDTDGTTILVTIPPITLDTPNVDIGSLDRMNVAKKDKLSELNGDEYRICEADAADEASKKEAIIDLAKENAENTIRGLMEPFLDGVEYTDVKFVEEDAS